MSVCNKNLRNHRHPAGRAGDTGRKYERARGPIAELDPAEVARSIAVSGYGGFLVMREAARRMVPRGAGVILLTGATASVKGFALSAPFAMGKFALRGLAESARELARKGVHVAHFIIDGGVRSFTRPDPADRPDSPLDPDAIAQSSASAPQRLELGDRIATVGRNLLTRAMERRKDPQRRYWKVPLSRQLP